MVDDACDFRRIGQCFWPYRIGVESGIYWDRLPGGSMVQKEWVEHHERHCTWHPAGVCRMRAADDASSSARGLCGVVAAAFGGAWTMAASRGRVLSRPMPMADIIVLMTLLLLSLSATGCWIHGIAVPMANSSEAMMTGTLCVCILSEIGPAPSVARQLPRMEMMDMVAMVPARHRSWSGARNPRRCRVGSDHLVAEHRCALGSRTHCEVRRGGELREVEGDSEILGSPLGAFHVLRGFLAMVRCAAARIRKPMITAPMHEANLRHYYHARADHGADGLAGDHAAAVERLESVAPAPLGASRLCASCSSSVSVYCLSSSPKCARRSVYRCSNRKSNVSNASTPRVRIRVPKKPCNVKLWLCSSGITPIRSVHTCFADSGADSVLAVLHAAIPARKRRRECGTVERHRPRHGGRHRIIVHIRRTHRRLVRHGRLAAVTRRHRRGRGVDVSDVVRDPVDAHPSQYAEGRHGFAAVPRAEADRVCLSRPSTWCRAAPCRSACCCTG